MPHIELANDLPGIVGLMMFRPETAEPLNALAETLLRADNSLSRGERESIAAYVSYLNECGSASGRTRPSPLASSRAATTSSTASSGISTKRR